MIQKCSSLFPDPFPENHSSSIHCPGPGSWLVPIVRPLLSMCALRCGDGIMCSAAPTPANNVSRPCPLACIHHSHSWFKMCRYSDSAYTLNNFEDIPDNQLIVKETI